MLGHQNDLFAFGSSYFCFLYIILLGLALKIKGHQSPGGVIASLLNIPYIAGQVTVNLELTSPDVRLSTDLSHLIIIIIFIFGIFSANVRCFKAYF